MRPVPATNKSLIEGLSIAAPESGIFGLAMAAAAASGAVRALRPLIEGGTVIANTAAGAIAYVVQSVETGRDTNAAVFRTAEGRLIDTGMIGRSYLAAACLAVEYLLTGREPFASLYLELADTMAPLGGDELARNASMRLAADALLETLGQDDRLRGDLLRFDYRALASELPELDPHDGLELGPLLANEQDALRVFLAGGQSPFGGLRPFLPRAGGGAVSASESGPATGFVGSQLGDAAWAMARGKHVLHHGPSGTGKSLVWRLAMAQLDPDFEPASYPYFVQGHGDLTAMDLIGAFIRRDGEVVWIDGPLTRAARDGKRLFVEEINRMPMNMLNCILAPMDINGRVELTAKGESVIAAPGFAVDATANLGEEYTGTEQLDVSVLRRFPVKIEYDFLAPAEEALLLRTKVPGLDLTVATQLVTVANRIRTAYATDGDLPVDLYVSPASLIETAALVAEGRPILEAIAMTWLIEVATTSAKRKIVLEAIEADL